MKRALLIAILLIAVPLASRAAIDASSLRPRVEVTLSPHTGSFVAGSTFEVPILVNSSGASINGIEVHLTFDKNRLEIVKPSSGDSIIGVWVEPPSFDNTKGVASYVGVVPNGIVTEEGLVGTVTFRAKATGAATVSLAANTKILLNDGLGTEAPVDLGRATYQILPKAPEGVAIYSDTHSFQDQWYKNNTPILSWDEDAGVDGFSYVLDNLPDTDPPDTINATTTSVSFANLNDGLWYFHIKAHKQGVWGAPGQFLLRIDTTAPAEFKPTTNYLVGALAVVDRALISYVTTDNLSGVDHYEVGVIDKSQPTTVSPAFVEAESPYQAPLVGSGSLHVIVRAVDKAGNIRDEGLDVEPPSIFFKFLGDHLVFILLSIIIILLLGMMIHYLFGHHIVRHLRRIRELLKKEEAEDNQPHV